MSNMTPKNDNLIYMVAIDHPTSKVLNSSYAKYAIAAWQLYCDKYNIDFIVCNEMDERISRPIWNKEFVFIHGQPYKKIGIVDSDTMPTAYAPNIFNEFSEDEFCAVPDLIDAEYVFNSIKAYQSFYPEIKLDLFSYVNAGVLFFGNQYLCIFEELLQVYFANKSVIDNWHHGGGREQTLLNYILQKNKVNITQLSPKWNLMGIYKRNVFAHNIQLNQPQPYAFKYANVIHYTGFDPGIRKGLMESHAKYFGYDC